MAAQALSTIVELHQVQVRNDIALRLMETTDGSSILAILRHDGTIREQVSLARRMNSQIDIENEIALAAIDPDVLRYSIMRKGICMGVLSFWRLGDMIAKWSEGSVPEQDTYGFGYFLDPRARGEGIVTDSIRAVVDIASATLSPKKFIAFCTDENTKSAAVLRRCGFVKTNDITYFPSEGWHERKYMLVPVEDI